MIDRESANDAAENARERREGGREGEREWKRESKSTTPAIVRRVAHVVLRSRHRRDPVSEHTLVQLSFRAA